MTESQQIPDKPRHPWCLTSLSVCFRSALVAAKPVLRWSPNFRGVPSRLNGACAGLSETDSPGIRVVARL